MGGIVLKSGLNTSEAAGRLSVVIITLNEEVNIKGLLADIPEGAEVIVVDSGSTDKTVEIARASGAQVSYRAFDQFSAQKNHALSLATRPWVLCLDADERPDHTLWRNIVGAVEATEGPARAYKITRRLVFLGRPLNFGRSKDHLVRLFPANGGRYENDIHETLVLTSGVLTHELGGILWHHSYRDLSDYFERFNRYTTLVAVSRYKAGVKAGSLIALACRLPLDFIVRYFLKLGFLDGWQGFLWALFGSFYGFVKYAKLWELKTASQAGK